METEVEITTLYAKMQEVFGMLETSIKVIALPSSWMIRFTYITWMMLKVKQHGQLIKD